MEIELTERQKEVLRLRESGLTLREIGEMWGVSAGAVSQLLRKIESKKAREKMREWEERWWQESVTLDLTLGQIYIIYEGLGILLDTLPEESLEERRQVSSLQEMMHELLTGSRLSPETVWSGIGKQLTPIENTAISEARLGISINQLSKRIGLIHHKTAKLYYEARRKVWAVEKSFLDSPEAQSHLDVQMLRCQIDIVENALFTLRDCRIDMKHQKSRYWEKVETYDPIYKGSDNLFRKLYKLTDKFSYDYPK